MNIVTFLVCSVYMNLFSPLNMCSCKKYFTSNDGWRTNEKKCLGEKKKNLTFVVSTTTSWWVLRPSSERIIIILLFFFFYFFTSSLKQTTVTGLPLEISFQSKGRQKFTVQNTFLLR